MKLSKDSRNTAKQLFQASFMDGRLNGDRLRQATNLLIERKPRNYLGILKEIQRLARLEISKHHAIIDSAMNLSQESLDRVVNDLRSQYGHDLTTELHIVPELLGGLRIQIGSDVFDGSVRGRLDNLEKHLAA
ncbi:MAG TPA: F0F1 ATP synthase subunit delta [Chthoniobacterales bacterium]|jgi:F-type H+-transporting ATPase subunit delta